jgi:peptidoglycan/xylan/chitin deacetylase (PgdA/CDA1 family)
MPDLATSIRRASPLLKASLGVHGLAVAALALEPAGAPLVAGMLIGNHLLLGLAGTHMRGSWLGPNLTRLPAPAAHVALTFDDGPDPEVTPRVLDLLDAAGQRATFFCIGTQAERHPALVGEIQRRGHGVENHSYSHPNSFSLKSPATMREEVGRNQTVLRAITGRRPAWFRPPAGIQSPWLADILVDEQLGLVSWTRRGFDTVSGDPARVAGRLVGRGVRGGDILLLHDRQSRYGGRQPVVLAALPRVLASIAAAGLRSEPIGNGTVPHLSPGAPGTR